MSIEALFNHHADTYRQLSVDDERARGPMGEVIELYEAVTSPAGNNCRPDQIWSGILQDHGPGDQQTAARRWFLRSTFDVEERDILDVTSGTDAPVKLLVVGKTPQNNRTALHHIEVNVEVWQGTLTLATEDEYEEAVPPDTPEILSVEFAA